MHDVTSVCQRRSRRGRHYRRLWKMSSVVPLSLVLQAARADDVIDITAPLLKIRDEKQPARGVAGSPGVRHTWVLLSDWRDQVARAKANQPNWSSALVTTTGLLENRLRFDVETSNAGDGTSNTVLDGGKGLDLIVGDSRELQFAAAPYNIRTDRLGNRVLSGFTDWPILRLEQRLASSPESGEDYVVTTWLQAQAPTGIERLSGRAWVFLPTLAFGKGWGNFDIQSTIGAALPTSHSDTLGHQIQTNIAFQYHVGDMLWPELETSWTYYPDGTRGGLNQVIITIGLVLGRFSIGDNFRFTLGGGYQIALAPNYRTKPLLPAYNDAWLFTSRLNFE